MSSGRVGKAIVLTCFFTAGYGRHRKLGVGFRTAGYGRHRSQWVKELQVKGNLFDCSQILTVASFAYKQQKRVSEFFISKYFFFKSDFCTINSHFLYPISKMLALAPEAEEHIK